MSTNGFFDTLLDQSMKKLQKKNVRERIVNDVVEPIVDETKNKYSGTINFIGIVVCFLIILLAFNLYYSIQVNNKLSIKSKE